MFTLQKPSAAKRAAKSLGTAWAVLAGVAAGTGAVSTSLAQDRPVLVVGGHFTTQAIANGIADFYRSELDLPAHWAAGVALSVASPEEWAPFVWAGSPWPGTASNEVSAVAVHDAIDALLSATDQSQVDVVAISQGALVTRWLVKNDLEARSKVAGLISLGGVNVGGPDGGSLFGLIQGICEDLDALTVCGQMVFDTAPGWTNWLIALNGGDPTPGPIAYYHVYTQNDPNTPETTESEALLPAYIPPFPYYFPLWQVPLPGATNRSVQQVCQPYFPNRPAPHAGVWPNGQADVVTLELVLDALRRQPLQVSAAQCQTVQW
jgi:pimeloyl-ACP methyl ester carboxylesterase